MSSFHALLDPFVILFSASGGFTNFQTLIKMETNQEICQETHKLCFILDQLAIVSLSDFTSFIGCTRQLSRQALVYHWTTTVTATGPHTSADVPVRTLTTGHKHLDSPDPSAANCYRYVSLSGVLISDIGFADIEIPETIFTIWKISYNMAKKLSYGKLSLCPLMVVTLSSSLAVVVPLCRCTAGSTSPGFPPLSLHYSQHLSHGESASICLILLYLGSSIFPDDTTVVEVNRC